MRGHSEMAGQGRIFPSPYAHIQTEMIVLSVGGNRMQVHCNGEDERPDCIWLGGLGKLACVEAEEGGGEGNDTGSRVSISLHA